jgi:opacity protein-like surface antigen
MLVGNTAFASVNGVKYSIGKTEGLSPVNFSSSFGLGLEYNLSEKISLDIEPTLRYYLSPMGEQSGSSTRPYSFGVFSGLSYKF